MPIISVESVTKIYNGGAVPVQALSGVSFSVEKGEFLSIVGPSGSGKTTLLNIIGGLDQPTSGNVVISGVEVTKVNPGELIDFRLNHIGFVFQAYNLIPVLTAYENVEFIMLLQKRSSKERKERAEFLLEAVGLKDKMHVRPSQLSGGQQQRVAVARALASNPAYVLADEPTANLDSVSAEQLLDLMEVLNHQHDTTFVFSTHDHRVIARAHRVITLRDGRIESDVLQEQKEVTK
ncbi:MAG: ABC transporter ATP-binding protein [Bacteroidetes bacterium]|nr:ABC transporter ATP-binding protein [Bacteroidota bacterium]